VKTVVFTLPIVQPDHAMPLPVRVEKICGRCLNLDCMAGHFRASLEGSARPESLSVREEIVPANVSL